MTDSATISEDDNTNEFDFSLADDSLFEDNATDTTQQQVADQEPQPASESSEEYALNLEGLDAEDTPYKDIFTANAKNAGLPADAASKFVVGFTKAMNELHARQDLEAASELKKEWGKNYESIKGQTLAFMKQLFDKAGLTPEEKALFTNPRGVQIGRKLMSAMGSRKALASNLAPPVPNRSPQEQIDELVIEMVEKQARPDTNPREVEILKQKINKIAGQKLY